MAQFPRLTNREWEVIKHLQQGKSNKLIASSLGISDRTVEFHLKNIYIKFQVSSRIELILKLGNTTGGIEAEKLGVSTVDSRAEVAENRDRLNSRMGWATSFRDTASIIGKELEMKKLLNSKHLLVGMSTSLVTGLLWLLALSSQLLPNQIRMFIVPLIIVWVIIGLAVGLVGKRNGVTLTKVGFSTLCGSGLSPFAIIPIMLAVVLPIGYFAEKHGLIDPSTIPNNVASTITSIIMMTMWLIVGTMIGIVFLFVTSKKIHSPIVQSSISENIL